MKNVTWDNRKVLWNSNTDLFRVTYCTVQSHITVSLIWPTFILKDTERFCHWLEVGNVLWCPRKTLDSLFLICPWAESRAPSCSGWGLRRTLCCVHRAHCSLEKHVSGVSGWRRVCVNYVLREKAPFSDWRTRFQKCVFTNREQNNWECASFDDTKIAVYDYRNVCYFCGTAEHFLYR